MSSSVIIKEEKPDVFFDETYEDICLDDDIVSELVGGNRGEETTSTTVLKYILDLNEAFNLSPEDISLLKRIKERLDEKCVPKDDQERLTRLNIRINWTVPVQHTLESVVGEIFNPRSLLTELKKMNLDIEMDTSEFTEEEDDHILSRWNKFSREYDFPDPRWFFAAPRFGGILPKNEKMKFAQYLGKELPNRFLCSIFHRFSQLYGKWKNKNFSRQEDQLLLRIKEKDYIKYKSIVASLLLNRIPTAVVNRTYSLSTPEDILYGKEKRKWEGFRDDVKLIKFFMRQTSSKTMADLESKTISVTHFQAAAENLRILVVTAIQKWRFRISTQCFAKAPLYKYDLCVKMITWLKTKNYADWIDIDWKELSEYLYNCQKTFLTALFRSIISRFDKYYRSYTYDFRRCVDYLYATALPFYTEQLSSDININRYRLNKAGYLISIT